MPISASQIEKFRESPIPKGISLEAPSEKRVLRGKDAIVIKIEDTAFKWYATLSGQSKDQLLKYAKESDQDEAFLMANGLKPEQVVDSHYFIASYEDSPELFAAQRWVQGQTICKTSLIGILRNRELRHSLSELLLNCAKIHQNTGRFPDTIGAGRIKIGEMDFFDPRAIVFPWYNTNIINENNEARIIDAKLIQPDIGRFKLIGLKVNHYANLGFARFLQFVNKVI